MQKTKKLFLNLLLFLLVLLLMVGVLEIVFSIAKIGNVRTSDKKFVEHSFYNPFLTFGPNINKRILQSNGEIAYFNGQGFRMEGTLPQEKKVYEYRIFALGASTTENLWNKLNLHYCGEANKFLKYYDFSNKKVTCYNSGKGGYSTAHTLIRLQFDLLPLQPDMITVMHNINDLNVNFFSYPDERNNYGNKYFREYFVNTWDISDAAIFRKSRLLAFTKQSMRAIKNRLYAKKVPTDGENFVYSTMRFNDESTALRSKEVFKNNLIALARIGKAHNITVVLMSQPAVITEASVALFYGQKSYNGNVLYPPIEEFKQLFEEYNQVIASVAEREGVHFIDMYGLLGQDEQYFWDMVHYTPDGIVRFSEIYAKALTKIIQEENEVHKRIY